ncbi:hypothetical protein UCRPC4_g03194 [Phaeomoniella chlamydospora]|uniref:Uncharacterized protein n=1 Tax=Phaeomoniella chlamydospora TaxID=158046 RepID=A0A0G2EKI3_PHACM|nr:hypothetical protein UCRPC4_g03194 [Phaeomoniella chlamydospora]
MAASQISQRVEEHSAAQAVIGSNDRGPYSDVPFQPGAIVQQLVAVDQQLHDAFAIIEASRQGLYDCKGGLIALDEVCTVYEQGYNEERRYRIECARAYKDIHAAYKTMVNDYNGMGNKYRSLLEELKNTQEMVHGLESRVREYENSGSENNDDGNAYRAFHECAMENGELRAKIRDLENEKSEMARDYEVALANALNHSLDQNDQDLEKARATAGSRGSEAVKQGPCLGPDQSPKVEPACRNSSADHEDTDQQQGRKVKRSRKRRQEIKSEM